ncbi:similar to Saccharomyces cerevisiae YPL103C FMP30 Mitochondrial inner membrane protein with a role in maintaining mitochondrial morphology and normal cardiolipin levels [Maudiozyma saulgeensis]|uniref:Similar to Saccharomyces cerevisiae YPL103C FMP30 Mitochondrial inner membrane protein with a role in maintaining mitochondrial morphology and normal cardiolipin levels n=1 Tax=Maudiozyma saulgeensis TaxID=1789683 RepID=A0A1X7R6G3_9SACH|nr:similar to Saccharomyces cerevisiae YPL103C FMP30 Mitochondrial inner membrane protein with a role in maintaining mitochondrial morphology and normal cardiolipin levels [Kazachstania saulgeensis]
MINVSRLTRIARIGLPSPSSLILKDNSRIIRKHAQYSNNSIIITHTFSKRFYSQQTKAGKSFNDKEKSNRTKKFFIRLGFGLLIPYTCYAVFVSLSAFREIGIRNKLLIDVEHDDQNFEGTLLKYSPLQVLGRYENPFPEYRIQTVYEFFFNRVVELFERNRGGIPPDPRQMEKLMPVHKPEWPAGIENTTEPLIEYKIVHRDSADFREERNDSTLKSVELENIPIYNTWLGQSCNYVMYNGLKIITDPIFSEYLLHENIGPKRITGRPALITEVPQPDIILISHNHPDHLDMLSLDHWAASDTLWIVPKGMGKFMRNHNVKNVIELSWWDKCELSKNNQNYEVACTPAMHWSGRYVYDTNQSLWCTFMFSHNDKPIMFHGGDTGYVHDLFKRIGQRYGYGVRLALLPCGQYCPEWHQRPRHINPTEVIKIMDDLKAKNVLGVHWGTFLLSGEYFLEPKEKLEQLAVFAGIRENCYCPELGQTIRFE